MRTKGAVTLFFLVLLSGTITIYSQPKLNVRVSASNLLRYGTGIENSVTEDKNKKYIEVK